MQRCRSWIAVLSYKQTMNYDSRKAYRRAVMGIVNCTPDSFFTGGGRVPSPRAIEKVIIKHLLGGADIIDIGGCSTRPYADEVLLEEEWRRVRRGLRAAERIFREWGQYPALSVDTFQSEVARRAIEEFGVEIINDVTGGAYDEQMYPLIAEKGVRYVAMHMRGTPQTMMSLTDYAHVAKDVTEALQERVVQMHDAGIKDRQIILDPGFGFAKTQVQEYRLLDGLDRLVALGYPVLVGISRKSMITSAIHVDKGDCLPATTALHWELLRKGADILRVHDVGEARQVVDMYNYYEELIHG